MKKITAKTINASRKNAEHSTGPTSAGGKRRSAKNALKHGIFAKELFLSEEETAEFQDLSETLRRQFGPATPMQEIAFDRVTCACWRCRLATRLEMSRIKKYSDLDLAEGRPGESTPEVRPPAKWYGSSRSELRAAMRFFEDLHAQISANGFLHHEDWKDTLVRTCGNQDLFDSLMQLKPEVSTDDILLFNAISAKCRSFDMSIPPQYQPGSEKAQVIVESRAKWEMAVRIVEERRRHLEDLARTELIPADRSGEEHGGTNLDGITRYLTATTRELERSVRWFQELKDRKL